MDRQRNRIEKKVSAELYYHLTKGSEWTDPRCCLIVTGQRGSGKTTAVLNGLAHKRHFYFSFKGLCSELARRFPFQ